MSKADNVAVELAPMTKRDRVLSYRNGMPVLNPDRTPTLIQNESNQYKFVPRELALELEKAHKAVILTPRDGEEFVRGTKLAMGIWDGFKPGEMIQIHGKPMGVDDIGRFNPADTIEEAKALVEKYKTDKKSGLVVEVDDKFDPLTFEGKKRERRFDEV